MSANTAQGVIDKAFVDAGRLPRGGTPSSTQYADGLDRLNDVINLIQTEGQRLWLEEEYQLVAPILQVGKQTYSFGVGGDVSMNRPLRVKYASYAESGTSNFRPLLSYAREEWTRLGNRSGGGSINGYFVDKQADFMMLSLWQVPDATSAAGTVALVLHTQASNPASVSLATGFPVEWVMALRWLLAADLATGMPQDIVQRCEQKATYYKSQLDNWDIEDAPVHFALSNQAMPFSRFR